MFNGLSSESSAAYENNVAQLAYNLTFLEMVDTLKYVLMQLNSWNITDVVFLQIPTLLPRFQVFQIN